MDWNRVEGNWKQVKGKVKEKWGQLTDDDLDVDRRQARPARRQDPGALRHCPGSGPQGHRRLVRHARSGNVCFCAELQTGSFGGPFCYIHYGAWPTPKTQRFPHAGRPSSSAPTSPMFMTATPTTIMTISIDGPARRQSALAAGPRLADQRRHRHRLGGHAGDLLAGRSAPDGRRPLQPLFRRQPRDAVPLAGRADALPERGAHRRRHARAPSSTRPTRGAGIAPDDIDTGVVILTGEALRRDNAQAIAGMLAEQGGEFVCATAGHHMEAMLAAYGSGAARVSSRSGQAHSQHRHRRRHHQARAGGSGRVLATAAIHIGGRLQVVDDERHIVRLDPAGQHHAAQAGFEWKGRRAPMPRARQGRANTWPTR